MTALHTKYTDKCSDFILNISISYEGFYEIMQKLRLDICVNSRLWKDGVKTVRRI